mgnify:CR=1 FL=1
MQNDCEKKSKVMDLYTAVKKFIHNGDTIYLAGFTHLIPFGVAHEIIRQGIKDLILCRATPDLIYDQMIFAGCARKIIFSWSGNPGVGMLQGFRKRVEEGKLEIEEYTHFGLATRLLAGAHGMSFYPLKSIRGSDLPLYNHYIKTINCPYTGEEVTVVPALNPDVGVIHAQRADQEGNVHLWGIMGEQQEVAFASKKLIVTVEEIVDESVIRSDPNRTLIPGFLVDAVVELPWGAHPSYAQGYYDRDNAFYIKWDEISRDEEQVRQWLGEWVFGVANRQEYIQKLGAENILRLLPRNSFSNPVNFGIYL